VSRHSVVARAGNEILSETARVGPQGRQGAGRNVSRVSQRLTCVGFLLFAGLTAPHAATAGPATSDAWANPFCSADVAVVPWDATAGNPTSARLSDRYFVQVVADGKRDVAAKVTLITASDAYSVAVPRTALERDAATGLFYAQPVLAAFDHPVGVRFAYVDSAGVDGAAPAACPTVVRRVRTLRVSSGSAAVPAIRSRVPALRAVYLQKLPPLPCGASYIPAGTGKHFGAVVGRYGNRARQTVVRLSIDSNGIPSDAVVVRSSGVVGLDAAALGAVEHNRYVAARFLCTPVVSQMKIRMDYRP
jgi:TonB family protein